MTRWKARVEYLLSVIELLFLSLTVEALQGKSVKTRCLQEWVGHLEPKFQGKESSLGNIFGFYKTSHACDRQTDGRTDGQTDGRNCHS